jgi:hypothetical protein
VLLTSVLTLLQLYTNLSCCIICCKFWCLRGLPNRNSKSRFFFFHRERLPLLGALQGKLTAEQLEAIWYVVHSFCLLLTHCHLSIAHSLAHSPAVLSVCLSVSLSLCLSVSLSLCLSVSLSLCLSVSLSLCLSVSLSLCLSVTLATLSPIFLWSCCRDRYDVRKVGELETQETEVCDYPIMQYIVRRVLGCTDSPYPTSPHLTSLHLTSSLPPPSWLHITQLDCLHRLC